MTPSITPAARPVLMVLAAIGLACGCSAPHTPDISTASESADARVCGAFSAINNLVHESQRPDDGPGPDSQRIYDFVGLANALNIVDKSDVTPGLNGKLTEYVYALAELGAAINHHEPADSTALTAAERDIHTRCGPTSAYLPDLPQTNPGIPDNPGTKAPTS